jgi:hypothetical protein
MGATLFYHPKEWRGIIGPIKSIIGGPARVGVNVNWEKICGCPSHLIYSTQYQTVSHTTHSTTAIAASSKVAPRTAQR